MHSANSLKHRLGQLVRVGLIMLVALFVAGCGTPAPTTTTSKQPELTIWRPIDSEDTFTSLIKQYGSENANVKLTYHQKSLATYELDSLNSLAAHAGPDIWAIRNDWLPKHHDKLVPVPATFFQKNNKDKATPVEAIKTNYYQAIADDLTIDNQVWGVPLSIDYLTLYINPKLFNATLARLQDSGKKLPRGYLENPPKTWDEFISYAKDLTVRDGSGKITQAGAALGTSSIPNSTDILSLIMLQDSTAMMSADGKQPQFQLPQKKATGEQFYPGANALSFYTDFARNGSPNQVWSDSMGDATQAFLDGKVAMLVGYRYFKTVVDSLKPDLKPQLAPVPQVSGAAQEIGFAQYWVETVTKSASATNQTAAWNFINWLRTQGQNDYSSTTSRLKPQKPTEIDQTDKQSPTYQASIARTWPKPDPGAVDQVFHAAIDATVAGSIDGKSALEVAARDLTRAVNPQ